MQPNGIGTWYCWSMFLKSYWTPNPKDNPASWPGHTMRCGRYLQPPHPLEQEETDDDAT